MKSKAMDTIKIFSIFPYLKFNWLIKLTTWIILINGGGQTRFIFKKN